MANYDTLKATIDAYIRANGVKAITGPVLNGVLRAMVDSVAGGLLFKGVATPSGNPGTPDQNVFFLATDAGTYTNYGGAVLDGKHAAFFVWAGSWTAYLTGIPTDASLPTRVSQLTNDAGYITADALAAFYTKAETDALLAGKQATLESGTNIKTINGESILGSGNIIIQGGGSEPYFIRGTIDFNQNPPAVTITSGTYAEALAAYNAGTPVYAALTEGNGAVNIYPLAQVISPFLVFIGIGADSVLAVALQSDGTVTAVNSALVHPSDLAPVATSGDYNDLDNKPTIPAPEIFWATYGTTTAAEIDAAVAAGKAVMCYYNQHAYILSDYRDNQPLYFSTFISTQMRYYLNLNRSNNTWSSGSIMHESASNKVSSWQGTPDNDHYPSEKLVKDYIDAEIRKCIPKDFRLIASGTVPEDTTLVDISTDNNGQPFSLSEFIVFARLYGNSGGYIGWVKMDFFGETGDQKSGDISKDGMFAAEPDKYYTVLTRWKRVGNKLMPMLNYRSVNNTSVKDSLTVVANSFIVETGLTDITGGVNKIRFYGWQATAIGAGTYYEIYGIDA